MAKQTLSYVKAKFETGDIPTGQDFIDLIDTLDDTSSTAVAVATVEGSLNIEVTARQEGYNNLLDMLNTEASVRQSATTSAANSLLVEITARLDAEALTNFQIAQEITARVNALSAVSDLSINNIDLHGNIVPSVTQTQSLGTSANRFKDAWVDTLHIATNTLYLGTTPVLGTEMDVVMVKADPNQSINMRTTGTGISYITSENGVQLSTSGLNASVKAQATGAGGKVEFGAASQANFIAPNINFTGAVDVTGSTVVDDLTVGGTLTINGNTFTVNSQTVEVLDNILLLNKGQVGSGVTAGQAGLRVDRGDAPDYLMVFDEAQDMFQVGMLGALETIASQNYVISQVAVETTARTSADALKANLASPTFTGVVTAPTFSGALSGNATTATTASACSGNAGSATVLQTARLINGVSFNGSANITINAVDATAREAAITAGTTAQYWRGDKTWQTLPTSLPASDVYAWAKAATKPSYSASEVGLGNETILQIAQNLLVTRPQQGPQDHVVVTLLQPHKEPLVMLELMV
jgi:hypothetical protein